MGVRAACVIGWPVEHSRSPLIHNYWLKQYGIAGEYRRELVPREEVAAFVRSLAARGYVGANVTVPHKEAALALSEADERARAVGAVNTLWLEGDVLRSTNTDVEGFLDNLDGLLTRGVERVTAVNRTPGRAEMLRQAFGRRVHVAHWGEVGADLGDAALLVNTTTLGMQGQPDLAIDLARLPVHAVVADLVYVPVVTPLLAAAKARGLRTADGLGMLLHQAVRGFALWFGKKPGITAQLRALVEADLDVPDKKDSR
jgi:shikimate dehydrogenase